MINVDTECVQCKE